MPTYQKPRDRVSGAETLPLHLIERLRAKAPLLAGMGAPARHRALPGDTASPSTARLGTCHPRCPAGSTGLRREILRSPRGK